TPYPQRDSPGSMPSTNTGSDPSRGPPATGGPRPRRSAGGRDGGDDLAGGPERQTRDRPVGVADDALAVHDEDRTPVEADRLEDAGGPSHRLVHDGQEREREAALGGGEGVLALGRLG